MSGIRLKNEILTITGGIPKSKLVLGKLTIFFEKKFNRFNRLMLRLVFGLNIENVKDSD